MIFRTRKIFFNGRRGNRAELVRELIFAVENINFPAELFIILLKGSKGTPIFLKNKPARGNYSQDLRACAEKSEWRHARLRAENFIQTKAHGDEKPTPECVRREVTERGSNHKGTTGSRSRII